MDKFRDFDQTDHEPRAEVSAHDVTPEQFVLIKGHFARHTFGAKEVAGEYRYPTGELDISGVPGSHADARIAKKSLEAAIEAARRIHPADDLDMSA